MFSLPKRFFCHSLRTGGLFLGWLGVVVSLFSIYEAYTSLLLSSSISDDESDPPFLIGMLILQFLCSTFDIITNSLLIYGAKNRRHNYILPWLIWYAVVFVLVVIAVIAVIGWRFTAIEESIQIIGQSPLIYIAVAAPVLVIGAYLWLCMLSLRKELRTTNLQIVNIKQQDDFLIKNKEVQDLVIPMQPPAYTVNVI